MGGNPLQRGPGVIERGRQRVLRSEPVVDGDGDDVGLGDQTGEELSGGDAEGGPDTEGPEVVVYHEGEFYRIGAVDFGQEDPGFDPGFWGDHDDF